MMIYIKNVVELLRKFKKSYLQQKTSEIAVNILLLNLTVHEITPKNQL